MTRPKKARKERFENEGKEVSMNLFDKDFDLLANEVIADFEKSMREIALLFRDNDNPPKDELKIIEDCRLTFDEKLAKLNALRARKRVKKQLKRTDRLHAHALGVRLD